MQILGVLCFSPRKTCPPLCYPSPEKVWADLWLTFPSGPEGVLQGERPWGGGLSLGSWPNSVVFLLAWLNPV